MAFFSASALVLEYVLEAAVAGVALAEYESNLAQHRKLEHGRDGDDVRRDAGKLLSEVGRLGSKVGEYAVTEHAVRMSAYQVVSVRVQLGRLDKLNGKVFGKVLPHLQVAHRLDHARQSTALFVVVFLWLLLLMFHSYKIRSQTKRIKEETRDYTRLDVPLSTMYHMA